MAAQASILAKVLIQVGADEPKEIGTIEIPVSFSVTEPIATPTDPAQVPAIDPAAAPVTEPTAP